MGSALSVNQYKYSDFVTSGADNAVENFMTSAINAMKNNILSGDNNEVTIDGSGIRLRKHSSDSYDPEQIWINNNALMFTDNNWGNSDGAKIGIGKFYDPNFESDPDFDGIMYGVVAPAIVGTLLAGKQLIIQSTKADGDVLAFQVDSSGASLHNAMFSLYNASSGVGGRIHLDPTFGIIGGNQANMFAYDSATGLPTAVMTEGGNQVMKIDDLTGTDAPKVNFWMDMDGNVWLRGHIEAESGTFRGSLQIGGANAFRVDEQGNLSIGGTVDSPNFYVDAHGNMRAKSGSFEGTLEGATIKGTLEADPDTGGWLEGVGIRVGENSSSSTGYNFYVDETGNITATGNVNLSNGNLTLGAGSISWNNLASDAQGEVQDAQDDAASALSTANSASSTASTANSNIRKLANGTYSGGTFISNKTIESPEITGGVIGGGEFTNLDKAAYLIIGPKEESDSGTVKTYGDLYLYGRNPSTQRKWETFRVKDNIGGASIFLYGAEILAGWNSGTSDNPIPNVTPNGNWDFQFANVTNLNATAVFG